jgi:hypothetical protein
LLVFIKARKRGEGGVTLSRRKITDLKIAEVKKFKGSFY